MPPVLPVPPVDPLPVPPAPPVLPVPPVPPLPPVVPPPMLPVPLPPVPPVPLLPPVVPPPDPLVPPLPPVLLPVPPVSPVPPPGLTPVPLPVPPLSPVPPPGLSMVLLPVPPVPPAAPAHVRGTVTRLTTKSAARITLHLRITCSPSRLHCPVSVPSMGLTCPPLSRFQDSLQQDLPAYRLGQSLYHLEGPIIPAPSERLGHPAGVITGGYLRKEDSGIFALYVCASSRVGGRDRVIAF